MKGYITKGNSKTGTYNLKNGNGNQDSFTIFENKKVIAICINDGCSACDYPIDASKINNEVFNKIASNNRLWQMPEKNAIKYISNEYKEAFSNSDLPSDQLCATTAWVLVNKETNTFKAFSVGDTAILSYNSELKFSVFLEPINIFRKSATYFTNDNLAIRTSSQFKSGTLEDISGFVIYSDGAEIIAEEPYNMIRKLVGSAYISANEYDKNENELFDYIKTINNDDISIGVLAVVDDTISEYIDSLYNDEYNEYEEEETSTHAPTPIEYNTNPTKTAAVPVNLPASVKNRKNIINFLTIPRTLDEILYSRLIPESDIVPTLITLSTMSIVDILGDKFVVQ